MPVALGSMIKLPYKLPVVGVVVWVDLLQRFDEGVVVVSQYPFPSQLHYLFQLYFVPVFRFADIQSFGEPIKVLVVVGNVGPETEGRIYKLGRDPRVVGIDCLEGHIQTTAVMSIQNSSSRSSTKRRRREEGREKKRRGEERRGEAGEMEAK